VSFDELVKQGLEVGSQLAPAAGVAALVAALLMLVCGWPWRAPRPIRARTGSVLSVSLGFAVGVWWLGVRPNWPPKEDQDRLLFVLFPAIVIVEILAALIESKLLHPPPKPPESKSYNRDWDLKIGVLLLPLFFRFLVAGAAAQILLYGSIYTSHDAGPGTRLWTLEQTGLIFAGLFVPVAGMWYLLACLVERSPGRAVLVSLVIALAGTAVVMMMSGYASGGPLAMPLAGAVVGVLAASSAFRNGAWVATNIIGLAVVGLFALLIIGHFFSELTWTNAALLFFAPALGVVPELPPFRRINSKVRTSVGVILTTIPVLIAIGLAQQKMAEDSTRPTSGDSQEPTLDDYMNFGK
jgi:hypothetical protein